LHDLKHTAAKKMAEAGVPESTMLALMGHMSDAMLERYSHIRMAAKRTAMDSLMLNREDSDGVPTVLNPVTIQMLIISSNRAVTLEPSQQAGALR
jgi:hypothetical protein